MSLRRRNDLRELPSRGAGRLADGHRESRTSWVDLLWDCRRWGMVAPLLAIGDGPPGALGRATRRVPRAPAARAGDHEVAA
jgi:hypothetical protein